MALLLNMRFGYGTMEELKTMRRKIRAQRQETVYKQIERRKALINLVTVCVGCIAITTLIIGGGYFVGLGMGKW